MSNKRQIGGDGKRKLLADGRQIFGGNCCCTSDGGGCSNACYIEFTSTYTNCAGWSTPSEIARGCFATGSKSGSWVSDLVDCLTYTTWRPATNMGGTCCSNSANCATAAASLPGTPTPTNRNGSTYSVAHGFPPDCTTTARCVGCCAYDISILSGCAAGTYRTGACGEEVPLTVGGNPSLAGSIGIFCGCAHPIPPSGVVEDGWWGLRLITSDNSGGSPDCIAPPCCCCNEQCTYYWCATNQSCDCTCPPMSGWVQGSPDGDASACLGVPFVAVPVPIVSTAC